MPLYIIIPIIDSMCTQRKVTDIQMESQNEVSTTQTSMINDANLSNKLPSLEQQPEVSRTRKILLILIGILLVSCQ